MKCIMISQPRYLPAINYIQRIYHTDLFVILDDVQRQGRGIENRNKILMNHSERWLTMPVTSSSRELISKTIVAGDEWMYSHKNMMYEAYKNHPYFDPTIIDKYYDVDLNNEKYLFAKIVEKQLLNLCDLFDFEPNIVHSSECEMASSLLGVSKLRTLCECYEADIYVSGSNGRNYGVNQCFSESEKSIQVLYHDYHYPVYKQNGEMNFTPWLTIFDMIFNCGLEYTKLKIQEELILNID